MPDVSLYPHQVEALAKLHNGSILVGGVGSGKSRVGLAYFWRSCGGEIKVNGKGVSKAPTIKRDLVIITTAKKRDSKEWEEEAKPFEFKKYKINMVVTSWNQIQKEINTYNNFFIFDEQRVCGNGRWSKSFLKIAKKNRWIMLSATPGDTWTDYIPVFIANGFYRNRTDFIQQHVIYKPYMKYPVIDHYINGGIMIKQRNYILTVMPFKKKAEHVDQTVKVGYDVVTYKRVWHDRWDVYDNCPVDEPGKLCYLLRKVVNSDQQRIDAAYKLIKDNARVIIFYNYTYELNLLREIATELKRPLGEWNGEVHSEIPNKNSWVYLCQYSAACEGWNCIETNCILFYSQSYSYKQTVQAAGRIDRLNTPYDQLYFYTLKSNAPIDIEIGRALQRKENFNESAFVGKK